MPDHTNPDHNDQSVAESRSLWWYAWRRLRRNKLAMLGLGVVGALVIVAIFAPWLAPMDPTRQINEYSTKSSMFRGNVLVLKTTGGYEEEFRPIQRYTKTGDSVHYVGFDGTNATVSVRELVDGGESTWHRTPLYVMGTDRFGRDVLSRMIYGARISLTVGLMAELITVCLGVFFGAVAGYFRGTIIDQAIMWMINVIWSFPFILLVVALSIAIGNGLWQAFVAIGIASWVDTARIVRGQFFSLRETEYVEATRALGFGSFRTIFRHILPNAMGPIIVTTTAGFANAILAEASLSYLGLGVQIPIASWGQMIEDGHKYIIAGTHWELFTFPSIAIALAVFGFNMLGDGLRDALDPKMKA